MKCGAVRRVGGMLAALCSIGVLASVASAGEIVLLAKSLQELLGPSFVPATAFMTTVMDSGNLRATTYSRAYTDGAGLYAYLYQVRNTGAMGNSPVEVYTMWPFTGVGDGVLAGWLAGPVPPEFLDAPYQLPEATGWVEPLPSGPLISFYYTLRALRSIDAGERSPVMFVVSTLPPDVIWGNVIDGSVGSGPIVGPIPEPATMGLAAAGVSVLLALRRKARSS